ncbi:MAG: hypothetical protein ACOH2K_03795 [Burkholderiaceae bacterium]
MKTKFFLTLFCGLLAACTTVPAPAPVQEPVAVIILQPTPSVSSTPHEIGSLLAYHQWLRRLTPAELARELADLQTQPKNAQFALKKSMLLTLRHNDDDLTRAQTLTDGVIKSTEPDALIVKPLARIFAANYTEMRRLSDQTDKLNQQYKESQQRVQQLQQTLEALKTIERTLPASPNGAPAATTPKGTP